MAMLCRVLPFTCCEPSTLRLRRKDKCGELEEEHALQAWIPNHPVHGKTSWS